MRRKRFLVNAIAILAVATFGVVSLYSQEETATYIEHFITVDVDEATRADAISLAEFLREAADTQQMPRAVRSLASTVAAEMETAALGRVDDFAFVTLDDGSTVAVSEFDLLTVGIRSPTSPCDTESALESASAAQPMLRFSFFTTPSGQTHTRPCGVTVCLPTGDVVQHAIPPVSVFRGPPGMGKAKCGATKKCVIKKVQ